MDKDTREELFCALRDNDIDSSDLVDAIMNLLHEENSQRNATELLDDIANALSWAAGHI